MILWSGARLAESKLAVKLSKVVDSDDPQFHFQGNIVA